MKIRGKILTLIYLAALLLSSSCANKVEIPAEHRVSGEVTVKHELVVSADMKALFKSQCETEATNQGITGETRSTWIQQCCVDKENEFLTLLAAFLSQESKQ